MMTSQYDSRTADKFVVRMPPGMRESVDRAASSVDTSMNTVFIQAVRQYLDGQQRQQLLLDALTMALNGKEELDAVHHWRGKHAQAIRERDALQQRLTAADERLDLLARDAARYRWLRDPDNREGLEPEDILIVGIAEGEDIVWLEQMDQAIDSNIESLNPAEGGGDAPCACTGCDASKVSSSLFCAAHRSAKSRTRGQGPLTAEGLEWLMQNDGEQQ